MSQQNTALIDDIMAALDAESSQNVELIVRNTQNGATKKMALASLEQIIYSYLTTAPVVTNLASVLGALTDRHSITNNSTDRNLNNYIISGVYAMNTNVTNSPYTTTEHWVGGTLVVYGSSNNVSGSPVTQVLYNFDSTTYFRICWDGTWSNWKEVTTQSY